MIKKINSHSIVLLLGLQIDNKLNFDKDIFDMHANEIFSMDLIDL